MENHARVFLYHSIDAWFTHWHLRRFDELIDHFSFLHVP